MSTKDLFEGAQNIAQDMRDRVTNLRAIKGERYGNLVEFCIHSFKMHSLFAETLANMTDEKLSPKQLIMSMIVQKLMIQSSEELMVMYIKSIGYDGDLDEDEIKDAIDMANKIHTSSMEHAAALAQ